MPWTCEMCRQWPHKGIWSSFYYNSYLVLCIWFFFCRFPCRQKYSCFRCDRYQSWQIPNDCQSSKLIVKQVLSYSHAIVDRHHSLLFVAKVFLHLLSEKKLRNANHWSWYKRCLNKKFLMSSKKVVYFSNQISLKTYIYLYKGHKLILFTFLLLTTGRKLRKHVAALLR